MIKFSYWFEKKVYGSSRLINVFKEKSIKDKETAMEKIIMIPNASDFSMPYEIIKIFDVDEFSKIHNLECRFVITYAGAHDAANRRIQLTEAANLLKKLISICCLIVREY